jgi:phosphorylcholine metabolism protein LicD
MDLYGTLLGAIREKDIICKDDDIDFMLEYKDYETAIKIIEDFCNEHPDYKYFTSEGYGLIMPTTITIVNTKSKLNVDIDFYIILGNRIYRHIDVIYTKYVYTEDNFWLYSDFYPGKKRKMLGRYISIPNKPEKFLTGLYGSNWHIPYFVCSRTKTNPCAKCVKNPKYTAITKADKYKLKLKTN